MSDPLDRTDLHYACADGDVDAVRSLILGGEDPDAADAAGWTPLHFATQAHDLAIVSMLIEFGVTIDARDENGNTPLSNAVFSCRGDGSVIDRLREAGADPYLKNEHGVSPLDLVHMIANYDTKEIFSDLPVPGESA